MDEKEIWMDKINNMNHLEMAILYRYAEPGHPVFKSSNRELSDAFNERFNAFGGWTPEISKAASPEVKDYDKDYDHVGFKKGGGYHDSY